MTAGKLTVTCSEFRPLHRNTLVGFAVIEIAAMRLTIRDVALHQKNESRWAQFPARAQLKDGALVKDTGGKIQYVAVMDFATKEVRDAFSAAVVRAVLAHAPDAFDQERAA
jgi:hypothetical protein